MCFKPEFNSCITECELGRIPKCSGISSASRRKLDLKLIRLWLKGGDTSPAGKKRLKVAGHYDYNRAGCPHGAFQTVSHANRDVNTNSVGGSDCKFFSLSL